MEEFTERGSVTIRCTARPTPGRLRFEVIDTGVGIPAARRRAASSQLLRPGRCVHYTRKVRRLGPGSRHHPEAGRTDDERRRRGLHLRKKAWARRFLARDRGRGLPAAVAPASTCWSRCWRACASSSSRTTPPTDGMIATKLLESLGAERRRRCADGYLGRRGCGRARRLPPDPDGRADARHRRPGGGPAASAQLGGAARRDADRGAHRQRAGPPAAASTPTSTPAWTAWSARPISPGALLREDRPPERGGPGLGRGSGGLAPAPAQGRARGAVVPVHRPSMPMGPGLCCAKPG